MKIELVEPIFTVVILLLVAGSGRAQFSDNVARHLDALNVARRCAEQNKTDSSILMYGLATKTNIADKYAWFELANQYLKNKNYKESVNAFNKSILLGYFPCEGVEEIAGFPTRTELYRMSKMAINIDSLKGIFYSKYYNWKFAALISKLATIDQFIRSDEMENIDNETNDSLKDAISRKRFSKIDTTYNLTNLLEYFNQNPFPKPEEMDENVIGNFSLVVHHLLQINNNRDVDSLNNIILKAVYNGLYDVKTYVRALDYRYIIKTWLINHDDKEMHQLYGTYVGSNEGTYIYRPSIDSLQSVDFRRAQWHLPSLADNKLISDAHPELPSGYIPQKQ